LHPDCRTFREIWECGGPKSTSTRKSGLCQPIVEGRPGASRSSAQRAVSILRHLEKVKTGDFVFAGQASNKPLSNMAMEMVLRRMKIVDATVHGFRSSFRDWAGNVSNFPREITETALAHVIGDKPNKRTVGATRSKSGASSWKLGLPFVSRKHQQRDPTPELNPTDLKRVDKGS